VSVSVIEPAYVKTPIFGRAAQASREAVSDESTREEMERLYEKLLSPAAKKSKLAMLEKASEPIVTTEAIAHALVSPFPHTRYVVANVGGIPATLLVWLVCRKTIE
jgi:hypothetical protein